MTDPSPVVSNGFDEANNQASGSGVSSLNVTMNVNPTAGNLLVAVVVNNDSGIRTYTFSDDNGNTWVQAKATTTGHRAEIWYAKNINSGATVVTCTINVSTGTFSIECAEIENADTISPLDVTGTDEDFVSNSTTHPSAAVGEIDTSASVYVVSVGSLNAAAGSFTAASGFTSRYELLSPGSLVQDQTSTSALTDERAIWTSGSSRKHKCIIAAFVAASGGVADPFNRSLFIPQAVQRAATY